MLKKVFKLLNSGEFTLFWRELLYVAKYAFCVLFLGLDIQLCYFSRLFHLCCNGTIGQDGAGGCAPPFVSATDVL